MVASRAFGFLDGHRVIGSADGVQVLDAMPAGRAAALLAECCGSSRWVTAMLSRRPFETADRLHAASTEVWHSLDSDDWLESFAHHPRIGQRASDRSQGEQNARWSEAEQQGVDAASEITRSELAKVNRAYEQRFGFIYIVCATGKSADEMLAFANGRMQHDLGQEIAVAAAEQHAITQLRLQKLVNTLRESAAT